MDIVIGIAVLALLVYLLHRDDRGEPWAVLIDRDAQRVRADLLVAGQRSAETYPLTEPDVRPRTKNR